MTGAVLLNESFTWQEVFSGGALSRLICFDDQFDTNSPPVLSLVGVVLIARPTFIFGSARGGEWSDIEKGTPAERLGAVG